ncbi:MAG: hypothetical protein K6E73_02160 [Bacteroidales bacterium]|nr:hypothetical protein [Bacteroidales bacterium]
MLFSLSDVCSVALKWQSDLPKSRVAAMSDAVPVPSGAIRGCVRWPSDMNSAPLRELLGGKMPAFLFCIVENGRLTGDSAGFFSIFAQTKCIAAFASAIGQQLTGIC